MKKTKIISIAVAVVLVVFLGLSMKVIDKGTEGQYTGEVAFDAGASSSGDWDAILAEIRAQTLNLVLIGMPGCGKTTLGERAARLMNREIINCDEEIVRRAGMPIPQIFAGQGEAAFRELERDVIADREFGHLASDCLDDASAFVAEHVGKLRHERDDGRPAAFVGMADAGCDDLHEDLGGLRIGELDRFEIEGCAGNVGDSCFDIHGSLLRGLLDGA